MILCQFISDIKGIPIGVNLALENIQLFLILIRLMPALYMSKGASVLRTVLIRINKVNGWLWISAKPYFW